MTKKMTFTPTAFEALKEGSLTDPQNPGLSLMALPSGKKMWKFTRRLGTVHVKATFGSYPALKLATARAKAQAYNASIELGIDPRGTDVESALTTDEVHALYMKAVRANLHKVRRTASSKPLAPRTITEKEELYGRHIKAAIGSKIFANVTAGDLSKIVINVGKQGVHGRPAPITANRTLCELRVFFGWATGLRAKNDGVHINENPTAILGQLWNAEPDGRERWLDGTELPLFLKALAEEDRLYRRALLLLLLTGTRKKEVLEATMIEYQNGLWVIPASRAKNGQEHPIVLGPWARSLFVTNTLHVIPSPKLENDPMIYGWDKILKRVRERMGEISGHEVEHFTLHDLRRTFRSHVDELVDETVAELMMNHKKTGLNKRYNRNKRAGAMAAGFAAWEACMASMAKEAGVSSQLEVPADDSTADPQPTPSPQSA